MIPQLQIDRHSAMRHQFIFLGWPCSSFIRFFFPSSKAIWRWRHQRNQSYRELSLRCSLRYCKSLHGAGYPPSIDSLLSSTCRVLAIKLGKWQSSAIEPKWFQRIEALRIPFFLFQLRNMGFHNRFTLLEETMRVIFIAGLTDGGHAIILMASTLVITHVPHHIIPQTSSLKNGFVANQCHNLCRSTQPHHNTVQRNKENIYFC